MVPSKSDPLWKKFVTSDKEYSFSSLATKMMYTRVKEIIRKDESQLDEAIDVAFSFFEKNINIAESDLELIKN